MARKKSAPKKFGHKRSKFEWDTQHELCKAGLMQGIRSEHKGIDGRQFRFDFAWPDDHLALECQGIVWGGKGRHQTGTGLAGDCEKLNLAMLNGWRMILITQQHLKTGEAVRWVKQALGRDV